MAWAPVTELLTPRLCVRPVQEADLPALLRVNGDDQVTRYLPYATWQTLADAQAWWQRMLALCATGTAQQLVLQRRHDGLCLGTLLLFKHDPASARAEVGYALGREHWRQGYAREALHAVLGHAFGPMGLARVEAEVQPEHAASLQLLLGLGFVREGLLRQRWVAKGRRYDVVALGLLAGELSP